MAGLLSTLKRLFSSSASAPRAAAVPPANKRQADTASAPATLAVIDPGAVSYQYSQKRFYRFLLPGDDYEQPVTVPQKLVTDILRNSLRQADEVARLVPRLPAVVPKLLHSLRDPDAASKDFVAIIVKDPAMTAAVLKLANSAYFNPISKRITDVEVAVVKLGIQGLRAVLSAAVLQPVLDKRSPFFPGFGSSIWHHSLYTAVLAEQLATQYRLEPFKAYLLGLVHDTGKITLFSELCRQLQKNGNGEAPGVAAFLPLVSEYSLTLSCQIAEEWCLPEELCLALREQLHFEVGQTLSPYGKALAEANLLAEQYTLWQAGEMGDEVCQLLAEKFRLPENIYERLGNLTDPV